MSTIMSRTKAKRLTYIYQGAAAVFLLLAIGLGVIGLPESATVAKIDEVSQSPAPIPALNSQSNSNSNEIIQSSPRVDAGSIAARLSLLDNAPVTQVPQEDISQVVTTEEPLVEESGALAKRVRYTGFISDDEKPLAFIRIDGVQRIIAQGGVAKSGSMGLDDLTIKAVRPKFILVSDGQIEDRITLADRSGPSISMSTGADVVLPAVPTREEDVVLTPEELERLEAMPARQRALQERILRREKMGKEAGSTMREPQASFRAGAGNSRRNQNNNN